MKKELHHSDLTKAYEYPPLLASLILLKAGVIERHSLKLISFNILEARFDSFKLCAYHPEENILQIVFTETSTTGLIRDVLKALNSPDEQIQFNIQASLSLDYFHFVKLDLGFQDLSSVMAD